jgi:flagellar biosynthesis/type III secretory pathway protein FliH
LSKIFKNIAAAPAAHEPLVMENLARYSGQGGLGGEIGNIERAAYEKGFRAGEKAGFEFGRKKAEVLFQGLDTLLDSITSFKEGLFAHCENDIVDLTFAIAKKVIGREVEANREIVIEGIRNALKLVVASGEILIRVNPKDLDVINQYKEDFTKYAAGVKGVMVEGDETVQRGGSVIETNFGEVDSTINGVLAEIEEKLRSAE